MGLSIKNPEVERLARKVAKKRGLSLTGAIRYALEQVDEKPKKADKATQERRRKALEKFVAECSKIPTNWDLTEDEILGYDENGVPTQ